MSDLMMILTADDAEINRLLRAFEGSIGGEDENASVVTGPTGDRARRLLID